MQYMHEIQHEIQSENGGISVTGTPTIALKDIWKVLTYAVFHTEFEFSIKLGGYWARILVFKGLLLFFRIFFKQMSKTDFETCYPM